MAKKHPLPEHNFFILTDKYTTFDEIMPDFSYPHMELDLGCGKGDFSVALAGRKPDTAVLAADVMMGRLRKVVNKSRHAAEEQEMPNLFFMRVEARQLVTIILPDQCLDRLHILCPDPWPKERHRCNRLLSSDIMMQLHRILKPGGIFHFSTDDVPYLAAVRKNVAESGLFEEAGPEVLADVADIKTGFELQWLSEGKPVVHIPWRRIH